MPLYYFRFAFCLEVGFTKTPICSFIEKKLLLFEFPQIKRVIFIVVVFRLDMVEIRGKRGRKVPVILTPEMINAVDVLIKTRKTVGIADENPYVFARPTRQSLEPMRAWDCLKKLSTQCEPPLSNPTNITSTRLRKYIATISQVLSLKETEVD